MPADGVGNEFESETMHHEIYSEFEDDLDEDDLDMFNEGENFEDLGFEENWNWASNSNRDSKKNQLD